MKKEEENKEEKIQTIQKEIFHIVTNNETNEALIIVGDTPIMKCNNIEEAIEKIEKRDYEIIVSLMVLVNKKLEQQKKEVENEN